MSEMRTMMKVTKRTTVDFFFSSWKKKETKKKLSWKPDIWGVSKSLASYNGMVDLNVGGKVDVHGVGIIR